MPSNASHHTYLPDGEEIALHRRLHGRQLDLHASRERPMTRRRRRERTGNTCDICGITISRYARCCMAHQGYDPNLPLPPEGCPLKQMQLHMVALLVQGLRREEIARQECLSYATVKNYIYEAVRAAGARSQHDLVMLAIFSGWLNGGVS